LGRFIEDVEIKPALDIYLDQVKQYGIDASVFRKKKASKNMLAFYLVQSMLSLEYSPYE
jgi:hypothetical protein